MFRGTTDRPLGVQPLLYNLLFNGKFTPDSPSKTPTAEDFARPANNQPVADSLMRSGFGLVLFDREAFLNNGTDEDPQASESTAYGVPERGEETWIDDNSVPLLINRYNGTLVRGE